MSGTLYINDEAVWMPAGWVFDGVLELIAAELEQQDVALAAALRAARTETGGFCDLRGLDAGQSHLVAQAAARAYDRLVAEGPAAFRDPTFYQGFIARFGELNALLLDNSTTDVSGSVREDFLERLTLGTENPTLPASIGSTGTSSS